MDKGALRRAQLVSPFGVGAMSVLVDGTSVITAGLDHWFEHRDKSRLVIEEYQEHDWRLESRLRVNEFRLAPDYRQKGQGECWFNSPRITFSALALLYLLQAARAPYSNNEDSSSVSRSATRSAG